jgi:AraC family transcriptional regulator
LSQPQILENGRYFGGVVGACRANGLSLAETRYTAGFHVPSHLHDSPFVCVPVDGSFLERYESDSYELGFGSMFYHPGEGVHEEHFGGEGGRCFVAQMGSDWLGPLAARGLGLPLEFEQRRGDRASRLAVEACREFRLGDSASVLGVEGLLVALLVELTRTRLPAERQRPRWLRRATELVHERYLQSITLAALAAEVDVHPSHLARSFARFHGCSVGELVRRLRLDHARELLRTTDRRLSEIALTAGFADQSHFNRTFKRRFGVTPGAYRSGIAS